MIVRISSWCKLFRKHHPHSVTEIEDYNCKMIYMIILLQTKNIGLLITNVYSKIMTICLTYQTLHLHSCTD